MKIQKIKFGNLEITKRNGTKNLWYKLVKISLSLSRLDFGTLHSILT